MKPLDVEVPKRIAREHMKLAIIEAMQRKAMGPTKRANPCGVFLAVVDLKKPYDEWVHTQLVSPSLSRKLGVPEGDRIIVQRIPIKQGHFYIDASRYKGEDIRKLAKRGINGRRIRQQEKSI